MHDEDVLDGGYVKCQDVYFRRIKSTTKTKDLSEVRKKIEQYVEESNIPIPKHFNEELRIRLAAQFKAVERHVVTSSRCESAVYEMDGGEKGANLKLNQLKPKHDRQKKEDLQAAEVAALSPQPKSKRSKKPPECTPGLLPGINRISLIEVGLPPKRRLYSPNSPAYRNQELNLIEISDHTFTSKCSTLSKSRALIDPLLSGGEVILKSPAISSSSPSPAPSPPFNNNQEPLQELRSVSTQKELELNSQLTQTTHGRTNVNALVMAYEKITAQANEYLSPGASITDQNPPELMDNRVGDTKAKFCELQTTPKLPTKVIPDFISQSSPVLPVRTTKKSKPDKAVKTQPGATTHLGRALLVLALSIVATPIWVLLYLRNRITSSITEDPINLQCLGIEIADDDT
ncbi:hypothetical protein TcWFU_000355 [Taenia crassiceps]|uniref:LEM domain-containing protein n=1 Tax=Taenia crassiceps TaxID=6207 RepID=A0ABR4QP22_9CEST